MSGSVLVTGGLGFIGSHLCGALLDEGYAVRCVDDLSGRYAPTTGPAAAVALASRGAEILAEPARPAHVRGVQAVIHLAGLPGVRAKHPGAHLLETNVSLPERLALAARAQGARFVLISSSSVYGNARIVPTPEHAPPAPLNPYAASKMAAERAVLGSGGDAVIVRPFTVYGPGQRPEMAFARWIAAIDAGEPVRWHAAPGTARDFTYVDDAVAGIVAALRHGEAGEAYNVSGWRTTGLREALELLGDATVTELRPSSADALVTSGCGRRAAAELGYAPAVELADGVERQLAAAIPRSIAA
ncbi:MAG TPA: NAD-dependent epimerase/dehydratase family protein [Thermoleophilaceae bacterium]|nr:NAD-dependent epimerase/dehydratase family protein [Thermoleophilaceae bacterium]